jgi:hypothetical protein
MFGVAAKDLLDVTRRVVPHPSCMSTSIVAIALELGAPAGPRPRCRF